MHIVFGNRLIFISSMLLGAEEQEGARTVGVPDARSGVGGIETKGLGGGGSGAGGFEAEWDPGQKFISTRFSAILEKNKGRSQGGAEEVARRQRGTTVR